MKSLRARLKLKQSKPRKAWFLGLPGLLFILIIFVQHCALSIIWNHVLNMEEKSVHIWVLLFMFASFVLTFLFHGYTPKPHFMMNHGFRLWLDGVACELKLLGKGLFPHWGSFLWQSGQSRNNPLPFWASTQDPCRIVSSWRGRLATWSFIPHQVQTWLLLSFSPFSSSVGYRE